MATAFANSRSMQQVTDIYGYIKNQNEIVPLGSVKAPFDLTVEGICTLMDKRGYEMNFKIPELKKFMQEEKVSDQALTSEVGRRIFIAESLKGQGLETDITIRYSFEETNHQIVDLVIRFLHGKRNISHKGISGMLNISEHKAYKIVGEWDSQAASKKLGKEDRENGTYQFAKIPDDVKEKIKKDVRGKKSNKEIATQRGVSIGIVNEQRSLVNDKKMGELMSRKKKIQCPSQVFKMPMFEKKKEKADSEKQLLRA